MVVSDGDGTGGDPDATGQSVATGQNVATGQSVAREQLRRLGTLTDAVYAVALVLVVQWLPLPSESIGAKGVVWVLDLFAEHASNLVAFLIAVAFLILYWLRSTDLGARVDRTDNVHVSFTILSVVSLLVLLYVVRVGQDIAPISRRVSESIAVALIGICSGVAFWRARVKGLLLPGVDDDEAADLQIEALTEPVTALITIPFAFMGEIAWNLAWLGWMPVARILGRRIVRARRQR